MVEPLEARVLLTAEVEPNNTAATATLFNTNNDTLAGTLSNANDVDYFAADFVRGQAFQITTENLDNTTFTNASLPSVSILDAAGRVKAVSQDGRTLRFTAPYAGRFFVRYESQTQVAEFVGAYNMQTAVTALTGTTEVEPNNDLATATDFGNDTYLFGEITSTTDKDHFSFDGTTNEVFVVQFSDAPELSPAVRLFSPDGTMAAESTTGVGLTHAIDEDGVWTIEFAADNSSGSFQRQYVARVDNRNGFIEEDLTDELTDASSWQLRSERLWMNGELSGLDDSDVYRFETTSVDFFNFVWGDNDAFTTQNREMRVFNEYGQVVLYSYDGSLNSGGTGQSAEPGTYYLVVNASSEAGLGAYSIRGDASSAFSTQRDVPLFFFDFDQQVSHLSWDWVGPFENTAAIPLAQAMYEARYDIYDVDITYQLPTGGEYVGIGVGDFGDIGAGGWGGGNQGTRRARGDSVTGNAGANWTQLYNGPTSTMIHEGGHASGVPHARHPLSVMAYTGRAEWFPVGSFYPFVSTDQHNAANRQQNLREYLDWTYSAGAQVVESNSNDAIDTAQDVAPFIDGMTFDFIDATPVPTEANPTSVRLGHFNADAHLDVVYADSGTDLIYLRMGNGDGTFGAATSYNGGGDHGWWNKNLVVGFFNDDQNLDIAHSNYYDHNVAIYLGNGDGTLANPVTYDAGRWPMAITTTDIDGDGDVDLVTSGANDRINVLRGNGDGTFAAPQTTDAGDYPVDVVSADVNNDGQLDMISANLQGSTISVMLNQGGSLAEPVKYDTGSQTYGVTAADFDGDGNIDLAAANRNAETVDIFKGDGSGSFQLFHTMEVNAKPYEIDAVDMDGDGLKDIVVGSESQSSMVFRSRGDFTFSTPLELGRHRGNRSQDLGDLNGDGLPDLISSNVWDDELFLSLSGPNDVRNDRAVIAGKIENADDVDFYSVTVNAGQTWLFDIDSAEYQNGLDSKLTLISGDGTVLAIDYASRDRDSGLDSVDPWITHTFSDAGTFYVEVASEYSTVGHYRLKMTPGETVDSEGPRVLYSTPQPGSTQESTRQIVLFTNDQIDPETLVGNLSVVGASSGNRSGSAYFDPMEQVIVWTADASLPVDTFTVTIQGGVGGVADLQGNLLDGETDGEPAFPEISGDDAPGGNFVSTFTIGSADSTPSRVTSSDYYRHQYNRGRFTLNFSDQLSIGSAQSSEFTLRGAGPDGVFDSVDDTTAGLDPFYSTHLNLNFRRLSLYSQGIPDAGEYRVDGTVIDEDGFLVNVAEPFTVDPDERYHGPSVIDVSTQPGGVIGVPTTEVDVKFSGAVDTSTLTTSSFRVRYSTSGDFYDGSAVDVVELDNAIAWNANTNTATFETSDSLANGYYLLMLDADTGGVRAVDGQPLDGEFLDSYINGTTVIGLWEDAPSGDGRPGGDYVSMFTVAVPQVTVELAADSVSEDSGFVSAVITRVNTDESQPFTVDLSSSSQKLVIPDSVEFLAGVDSITMVFDVIDNSIVDDDVTVIVNATAPQAIGHTDSIEIVNDDFGGLVIVESGGSTVVAESGTTDSFTVNLLVEPASNVSAQVTVIDATELSVDVATLLFTPANWNVAQTVNVTGLDDPFADGDVVSRVEVQVVDATSDDDFDGIIESISATTTSDETIGFVVTQSDSTTIVSEDGNSDTVNVVLSGQPETDVVILVQNNNPAEIVTDASSLTFTSANWNIAQSITTEAVDDITVDGDQQVIVQFLVATQQSDDAFDGLAATDITVTTTDNDEGGFSIAESGSTIVTDNGSTDSFTIVLQRQPLTDVVFAVTSSDSTEASVSLSEVTFTAANWNIPQQIVVTGVVDEIAEGDLDVSVVVKVIDERTNDAFDAVEDQSVSVLVVNDESPEVVIDEPMGLVAESGTTDTFSVVLSLQPIENVVLEVVSSDESEVVVTQRLTFTIDNWDTPQFVTVTGVDDSIMDGDHEVDVVVKVIDDLSAGVYDDADDVIVTVTNVNDEVAGFTVSATDGDSVVDESGSTDQVTVVLDVEPLTDVVLSLVSNNTDEVTVETQTLTFTSANWNQAQFVTVTGVDDHSIDGVTTTQIGVSVETATSDDFFDTVADQTTPISTRDDDMAGFTLSETDGGTQVSESGQTDTVRVSLTARPTGSVQIDLTSSLPSEFTVSPQTLIITAANWDINRVVTVTAVNDSVVDGMKAGAVNLVVGPGSDTAFANVQAMVPLTVTDDEIAGVIFEGGDSLSATEGGTDQLGVRLTAEPESAVVFDVTMNHEGQAQLTVNRLTFTPQNWNQLQLVSVTAIDDDLVDGNHVAQITFDVVADQSSDLFDDLPQNVIDVAINDNDVAELIVVESAGASRVEESAAGDSITVRLAAEPTSSVVVDVTNGDGSQLSVSRSTLTFTADNWNQAQSVDLSAINDDVIDGRQQVAVNLTVNASQSADEFDFVSGVTIDVIVDDDEVAGFTVTESDGSTIVDESATSDTFSVVLNAKPTGDVVLTITGSDVGEASMSHSALTFTPENWNSAQEVTVTGVTDNEDDGDQTTTIMVSVDDSNSISSFANVDDRTVSVTTVDVDSGFSLDIDADGATSSLTDGILIMRYLSGFTGQSLINGAFNAAGERTSATEVFDYLELNRAEFLDIDSNGRAQPFSDGILALRYLAGFRGASLVSGAVDFSGERTDATEIATYLGGFEPPAAGPTPANLQMRYAPTVVDAPDISIERFVDIQYAASGPLPTSLSLNTSQQSGNSLSLPVWREDSSKAEFLDDLFLQKQIRSLLDGLSSAL